MALVDSLRRHLEDEDASSFQLAGEDLVLITGPDLEQAARAYRTALETVPLDLRERFEREHREHAQRAAAWLRRYNRNLYARVKGYVQLGRVCGFEYPWPVVAVLGICTVLDGMGSMRMYGLLGQAAKRLGATLISRITEGIDDLLRRTNRGIFMDSVPLVLFALRCHELRAQGDAALADALLTGPLPPAMDDESRALARKLYQTLALSEGAARFRALSDLTLEHFGREQAIFTHHFGVRRSGPLKPYRKGWETKISNPSTIIAPALEKGLLRKRRVVFRTARLPADFDFRNHPQRVQVFGELFVSSITQDRDDYQIALDYVMDRFGREGERIEATYPAGGAPAPGWE